MRCLVRLAAGRKGQSVIIVPVLANAVNHVAVRARFESQRLAVERIHRHGGEILGREGGE